MKIITKKSAKKFSPEYGWVNQISFFVFGFKFCTENHFIEIISEPKEEKYSYDVEEMTGYQEWREKMHLMRLEDDVFIQILNTRF